MKILFFTPWYPTTTYPTSGVFVLEHAKAAAMNHSVTVAVTSIDYSKPDDWSEVVEEILGGLPTIRLTQGQGSIPKLRYISRLRREVRFLTETVEKIRPDLIHVSHFQAAVAARIVARRFGITYVVSEHWSGFYLGTVKGVELLKARYGLNGANRLLPVSDYLGRLIASHGVTTPQEALPNAIDCEIFRPGVSTNPRARFLAIGSFSAVKGFDVLIEAAALVRKKRLDFELTIVGDGPERKSLESQIERLDLGDAIRLTGVLSKPEIRNLMIDSTAFVLPSRGETFGVAMVEAMAAGLPVVATDVGPIPELVQPERGIVVKSESPVLLADGIELMIASRSTFDSIAISKWVSSRFSREVIARQIDRIYSDAVKA